MSIIWILNGTFCRSQTDRFLNLNMNIQLPSSSQGPGLARMSWPGACAVTLALVKPPRFSTFAFWIVENTENTRSQEKHCSSPVLLMQIQWKGLSHAYDVSLCSTWAFVARVLWARTFAGRVWSFNVSFIFGFCKHGLSQSEFDHSTWAFVALVL